MDYKKYSLEHLENWVHDAMSVDEVTPQEIYDTILKVVRENYYTYKEQVSKADKLLALLNGNDKRYIKDHEAYDAVIREREYYEPSMPPWGHSDLEYLSQQSGEDKIIFECDKDDSSPKCQGAWSDFWEENYYPEEHKEDKVVKWVLPVQVDGLTGDCFVNFPDDLLEAADLKEGDVVNWIDRGDGSFELRKVTKPLEMDEC